MAESRLIVLDKNRRTPIDDAELVAALRAGDDRAYTVAWIELGPMVRRLVTRFFGTGADAPDLSQEVFLRLFRRINELRNPSGLRGFVVGICLGVARNELRRVRVRRWVRLTSSGELPDFGVAGPDLEARQALRRLYAILDQVTAHDRSLFVARFFEKMEIAEVAVAHGLSYGTAKRHVARATARINKRLERDPLLAKYLDSHGGEGGAARGARSSAAEGEGSESELSQDLLDQRNPDDVEPDDWSDLSGEDPGSDDPGSKETT